MIDTPPQPPADTDLKLFVFGGIYRKHHSDSGKFALVRPSGPGSLPYVYDDCFEAQRNFRLCEHHSGLYATNLGKGLLILKMAGELPVKDSPLQVVITSSMRQDILTGLAKRKREAAKA